MILILTRFSKENGVFKYRTENLTKLLKHNGINEKIVIFSLIKNSRFNRFILKRLVKRSNIIIYSRPIVDNSRKNLTGRVWQIISSLNKNCKLFFDIDDLLTSFYSAQTGNNKSISCQSNLTLDNNNVFDQSNFSKCKGYCIIVSTDKIANFYNKALGYKTLVISNLIDKKYLEALPRKKSSKDFLNLLYMSGSLTHMFDFSKCSLDLFNFINNNKNVRLVALGNIPEYTIREFRSLGSNKFTFHNSLPYKDMIDLINTCDVIINPLDNNKFNDAKSNIKYLEAAVCKKPIIVTEVDEFKKVIKDKENGLLVNRDNSNWGECLDWALNNKEKLKEIGENAYKEVKENWTIENYKSSDLDILIKEIKESI